jgi:hypothetical protein
MWFDQLTPGAGALYSARALGELPQQYLQIPEMKLLS